MSNVLDAVAEAIEAERADALEREKALRADLADLEGRLAEAQSKLAETEQAGDRQHAEAAKIVESLEGKVRDLNHVIDANAHRADKAIEAAREAIGQVSKDHLFESVVARELAFLKGEVSSFCVETLNRKPRLIRRNPLADTKVPHALDKYLAEGTRKNG